jgi:hypothetical protein
MDENFSYSCASVTEVSRSPTYSELVPAPGCCAAGVVPSAFAVAFDAFASFVTFVAVAADISRRPQKLVRSERQEIRRRDAIASRGASRGARSLCSATVERVDVRERVMCENDVRPSASREPSFASARATWSVARARARCAIPRRPGGADATCRLGLARVRASDRSHMEVFRTVYAIRVDHARDARDRDIRCDPRTARDDREKPAWVERRVATRAFGARVRPSKRAV